MRSLKSEAIIFSFIAAIMLFLFLMPDMAFAQASPFDSLDEKGGQVTDWLTGGFGKIVGTIALVALAVGMLAGKISWQVALIVIGAIIIIFNAGDIVAALQ